MTAQATTNKEMKQININIDTSLAGLWKSYVPFCYSSTLGCTPQAEPHRRTVTTRWWTWPKQRNPATTLLPPLSRPWSSLARCLDQIRPSGACKPLPGFTFCLIVDKGFGSYTQLHVKKVPYNPRPKRKSGAGISRGRGS